MDGSWIRTINKERKANRSTSNQAYHSGRQNEKQMPFSTRQHQAFCIKLLNKLKLSFHNGAFHPIIAKN
jgi:hypothetical protein